MRLHINLDDEMAKQIDEIAGARKRSRYIREAIEAKLEVDRRVAARRRLVGAYPDFAPWMTADWIGENRKREGEARQKKLDEWSGARSVVGLVLDTSVLIDLMRGDVADPSVLDAAREPVMISTMTVHEVLFGLQEGERAFTDAVLSSFAIVPVGVAEAELSAFWRKRYRAQGLTLEITDTAIAATAAIRNVPLATGNLEDFPMPELQVEEWRI